MFDSDSVETFDNPGSYEDRSPIARRIARRAAAEASAIGRPSVFAPSLPEWVRRAQTSQLPVKEYAR